MPDKELIKEKLKFIVSYDFRTRQGTAGKIGILDESFSKEIAPSAGLRNRLIHEYEKVDLEVFYRSLKKFVPFYFEYIKKIEEYLRLN